MKQSNVFEKKKKIRENNLRVVRLGRLQFPKNDSVFNGFHVYGMLFSEAYENNSNQKKISDDESNGELLLCALHSLCGCVHCRQQQGEKMEISHRAHTLPWLKFMSFQDLARTCRRTRQAIYTQISQPASQRIVWIFIVTFNFHVKNKNWYSFCGVFRFSFSHSRPWFIYSNARNGQSRQNMK